MYLVKDAKQVYAMRAFVSGPYNDLAFPPPPLLPSGKRG
jgi:hypothetical protein